MKHSVTISISAETDGRTVSPSTVEITPQVQMDPDAERLFVAMLDTAARLALGAMARKADQSAEEPAA